MRKGILRLRIIRKKWKEGKGEKTTNTQLIVLEREMRGKRRNNLEKTIKGDEKYKKYIPPRNKRRRRKREIS